MLFGKINYLNLLPFHVFMKRYPLNTASKAAMNYKADVPAKVNSLFEKRKVGAAFVSSIVAQKYSSLSVGIVAKKEVMSVLVIPSSSAKTDKESATSNVLAAVLGIDGEVMIGDKALKYALCHNDYTDLAKVWQEREGLPFVFALLSYHGKKKRWQKIEKKFLSSRVKIPRYLLHQAALKRDLHVKDVEHYLSLISYRVDARAQKSLRRFYAKAKQIR